MYVHVYISRQYAYVQVFYFIIIAKDTLLVFLFCYSKLRNLICKCDLQARVITSTVIFKVHMYVYMYTARYNNHSNMNLIQIWVAVVTVIISCIPTLSQNIIKEMPLSTISNNKESQLVFEDPKKLSINKGKDTNTPNFIRLLLMRLIYGIATSMGLEEQLEAAFNSGFVPPNANDEFELDEYDDNSGAILFGNIFSNNN